MTVPPELTDRVTLTRNRARATATFLHDAANGELHQRLAEVNKEFTSVAVVTGFHDFWAKAWPNAQVIADSDLLAITPGAYDLVIHALSLHWANDPVGQLIQCRRALRPDGLFLAVAFGGQSLSELRACLAEAEAQLTGGLSPRVLPMGEIRDLGGLLQRAGFALPVADSVSHQISYRDAFHLMQDLRAMGEGNALALRQRRPAPRSLFQAMARRYADTYGLPGGRIAATCEMIFLTGWAPDDGQPKPLRPGSAIQRLAAALGTGETALPDPALPDTAAKRGN